MDLSHLVKGLREMADEYSTDIYLNVCTKTNTVDFGLRTSTASITRHVSFNDFLFSRVDPSSRLLDEMRDQINQSAGA